MSDQDFFFDEEEETAKETASKTSAKSSAKTTAAKPATKAADKPAPVTNRAAAPAGGGIFEQNVSMTIAALMTVIGLLIGVIIGFVLAPDAGSGSTAGTSATSGTGTSSTAPQLSEDQLNGGLPAGHPDIAGATGATETPAP